MYEILLKPGKIGKLEIKNRLVMTPAMLAYATRDGYITDQIIEFYRRRAQGGVGLITIGAAGVDPLRLNTAGVIQLSSDKYIPGMKSLVDAIHSGGAKASVQLWHPGAYAIPDQHNGQVSVAPSEYFCNFTHAMTRELQIGEIEEIIGFFADAAVRAKQCGFDCIELIGSAGYLISQFLSSATNHRNDKYGGDLNGRMTFLKEVYLAVRSKVGTDYPIIVRLAGNEFVPGGNDNDDCVEIAKAMASLGVDAFNITGGWHETAIPQVSMDVPHGAYSYLAKAVKENVSVPVFACNRMNVKVGSEILQRGDADFIGMCREFIADPDIPIKLETNHADLIRPCIGCNQGCMDHIFRGVPLGCLCNPDAGFESENSDKIKLSGNTLVIGAGTAGLEYALRAARAGASITVWDSSSDFGGQMDMVSAAPGRKSFSELAAFQYNACLSLGVKFEFNKTADADEIADAIKSNQFDNVVIATGASVNNPDIPTEEGADVVSSWDVLRDKVVTGKNVVVIGAGAVGVETALKLASIGTIDAETLKFLFINRAESPEKLYQLLTKGSKHVTLIASRSKVGADIGSSTKWIMMGNLKRFGVEVKKESRVIEIKKDCVVVQHPDESIESIPMDTAVLAVGSKPNDSLAKELENKIPGRFIVIGDANKPGKAYDAMADARNAIINGH